MGVDGWLRGKVGGWVDVEWVGVWLLGGQINQIHNHCFLPVQFTPE